MEWLTSASVLARWLVFLVAGQVSAQTIPSFSLQATPPGLTPGGYMATPAAGDLDGDGDIDIVTGDALGALSYFRNDAGPGAPPAYTELTGPSNPLSTAALGFASTAAIGDLDADGDLDVLAGRGDGSFVYFQNTSGPTAPPVFALPAADPFGLSDIGNNSAPAIADIDGDGDPDVLAGRTDGTVVYFENIAPPGGAPAFVMRTGAANPLDPADVGWSSLPVVADLEGDGDLDVVVGDVHGTLTLFENTAGPGASPTFAAPVANPFGLSDAGYASAPAVVDLDRDGDLDLMAGTSVGTAIYFHNGAADPLAVRLVGAEGWRMLASPIGGVTLASYLGPIWTQGVPGADNPGGAPNVLRYDETVTGDTDGDGDHDEDDGFVAPLSMSEASGAGRGLLAYVYEDDDMVTPGTQGGFPKTLMVSGSPRTTPFTWGISGTGADGLLTYTPTGGVANDGWNLLGNPFASWFDWDAGVSSGMDAVVYVYDPAIANYRTHSRGVGGNLPGGIVGAFQAFWIHATAASPSLVQPPAPADGGPVYGLVTELPALVHLSLRPDSPTDTGGLPPTAIADLLVALGVEGSSAARDGQDAYALTPPTQSFVYLATLATDGTQDPTPLAVDVRPWPETRQEIELAVAAVAGGGGLGGPFVLRWPGIENVPEWWAVRLLDRETGTSMPLNDAGSYSFVLANPRAGGGRRGGDPHVSPGRPSLSARTIGGASRFALVVDPGVVTGPAESPPSSLALSAVRPNPVRGRANLTLAVPSSGAVMVELLDGLGRRIATLHEGVLTPGAHRVDFDSSLLRPGTYLIRVNHPAGVVTRPIAVSR